MADDLFVAGESFVTRYDGQDQVIQAGHTVVRQGHPILQGRESMFRPLVVHYDLEPQSQSRTAKQEAEALGIKVDGRWSDDRIRDEIAKRRS